MDSVAIAALFGHAAFWVLLACGVWLGDLRRRTMMIFLCLWLAGFVALRHFPNGAALFAPGVAALDIALVFAVFRGDIRLS